VRFRHYIIEEKATQVRKRKVIAWYIGREGLRQLKVLILDIARWIRNNVRVHEKTAKYVRILKKKEPQVGSIGCKN